MPVLKNRYKRGQRGFGRNQNASAPQAAVVVTSTGTTNMTLTFSLPVVVSGNIATTVATRTLVSQTQVSPTVITQVWSGNVTALAYTFPSQPANVRTQLGGTVSGTSGTFP